MRPAEGEIENRVIPLGVTMTETELVVLSTFRAVTDAQLAKGILHAVEIESTIRSDNAGGACIPRSIQRICFSGRMTRSERERRLNIGIAAER